jgi:Flp pilus assembly protein TadD
VEREPAAADPRIRIERASAPSEVDPALAQAYQALQAGDLSAAEGHYRSLLVRDRRNRDALLGLAAIAVKRGDPDAARRYYRQALVLDPRDPLATAGLAALDGPTLDPAALESRLKILLAGQPEAAALHFALGNLYAAQSRWSEAQQAYFQAFKLEPGNADYAYNLAVSLDHLNEVALAGQYYRRALALAGSSVAAFDPSWVEARLRELGKSKE